MPLTTVERWDRAVTGSDPKFEQRSRTVNATMRELGKYNVGRCKPLSNALHLKSPIVKAGPTICGPRREGKRVLVMSLHGQGPQYQGNGKWGDNPVVELPANVLIAPRVKGVKRVKAAKPELKPLVWNGAGIKMLRPGVFRRVKVVAE